MGTQVTLKIKEEDGQVKKVQHEVEEINLFQFEDVMKSIKDIFTEVQQDESLKATFKELFDDQVEQKGDEGSETANLEEKQETESEKKENAIDERFIKNAIGSFETLAVHMPGKAFSLLAALSGIDLQLLKEQKMTDVFDIFDAVVEENDLERLFNRAKKSLAATKIKLAFMKKVKKATTPVLASAKQ